jgi:AcrR family transcriptional regulator
MTDAGPKWTRRKDARPGEIIEAALELFVLNGFAATRLTEVAQRAGVVKGTLYRYFDTKEELFRATVRHLLASNLALVQHAAPIDGTVAAVVPSMLRQVARGVSGSRIPAIVRMVLAESRAFPDLASIWHDEVVSPMLDGVAGIIARGQVIGEIRSGDPRLHALSVIGPMVTGALYREVFGKADRDWLSLEALAVQHAETVVRGLSSIDPTYSF